MITCPFVGQVSCAGHPRAGQLRLAVFYVVIETPPHMDSRQAKDFFVEQVAQQAAIEGIPLSDLERRMMYFTEGPDAVEDPVQLDEEFEAQYGDSENYDFE